MSARSAVAGGAFDAVIFDLDGTLIDTERLVVDAGLEALAHLGHAPRRDLLNAMVGTVNAEGHPTLAAAYGAAFDAAAFDRAWAEAAERLLTAGIPCRPGARALLTWLRDAGLPVAVATNSRTASARANLARAGLDGFFGPGRVIGRDAVAAPKPAPDVFLGAAAVLGVAPARCLAFEDSDPGTEAAHAAGMTVVLVPDQRAPSTALAHVVADSLLDGARRAGLCDIAGSVPMSGAEPTGDPT